MVHASYRTVRSPRHSESECENCGVSGVAENSLKYSEIRRAWAFNALLVKYPGGVVPSAFNRIEHLPRPPKMSIPLGALLAQI